MSFVANTTKRLPSWSFGNTKGKIIVSEELQRQIDYLHKKVPHGKEWIGLLFYKLVNGDLDDPSDFIVEGRYIYTMDIGTEAFTAADVTGEKLMDMYEKVPGAMPGPNGEAPELKYGLIHTHHNMSTFFSGVDQDELHQNAPFHNYYVSLIVNYAGTYCAKCAYVAKVITKTTKIETLTYKRVDDSEYSQEVPKEETTTQDVLVTFDLEVERQAQEVLVSADFQSRFAEVEEEKRIAQQSRVYTSTTPFNTSGGNRTVVQGFQGQGGHTAGSVLPGTIKGKDEGDWEDKGQLWDSKGHRIRGTEENRYSEVNEGWIDTDGEGYPSYDWRSNSAPAPLPGVSATLPVKKETKKTPETGSRKVETSPVSGLISVLDSSTAKNLTLEWLQQGVESDAIQTTRVIVFKNAREALAWFDTYFIEGFNTVRFMYFMDIMAKKLIAVTKDYAPELIERRFSAYLNTFISLGSIVEKFNEIVSAHPIYSEQLNKIRKDARGSKGTDKII